MSQYFQGPELMTLLSRVFLCVITACLMSHALEIFLGGGKGLSREIDSACRKLDNLSRLIIGKAEEAGRLEAGRAGQSAETVDNEISDLRAGVEQYLDSGPGDSLSGWFEQEVSGLGSFVEHILEGGEALRSTDKANVDPGSAILSREAYEYKWRLTTIGTIAPLAGMAPTMSGTMEFLRDYSSSISEGTNTLPLSGLNTALGTTWWGCCLAIISVILLSLVLKRNIPKVREMVQGKENQIRLACSRWKAAMLRVGQVEQWRVQDV